MKPVKTVGVVGAGTMGAALAQKFAQENFQVILADREMKFVEKGLANIKKMLDQGVERRVFTQDQVDAYLKNIRPTEQLQDLAACDMVIEAIYENFDAKISLFKDLDGIVSGNTILATNTSSFSVSELASSVSHPERFIGLHFFYHAAKNRLVEIIPGKLTSDATVETVRRFAALAGKDAIFCKDAYGFVVNRFFVPWLNESVRLLAENVASTGVIDQVCMDTFHIGMGPFALMNATGVPVAYHAEKTLEVFGNLYEVAPLLKEQAESGKLWDIEDVDASKIDPELAETISERMLGVVFFVCSQILEENICNASDLNRGARIGLRWAKGPVDLMKMQGEDKVKSLTDKIHKLYGDLLPDKIGEKYWKMEYVTLEKVDQRAIITMNRPEDLNALNEEVMHQLEEKFDQAQKDTHIDTIFITGTGKAFVAGADIRFFVKNMKANTIDKIESFTQYGQQVFDKIDRSNKKVIMLVNGMTLGGGLELALCGDLILATPKAVMGFPETGIGIYPGLGGTQRTQRKIGRGLSKYMIYTGKLLKAKDAEEIGLVDRLISEEEMYDVLTGKKVLPHIEKKTLKGDWEARAEFFENNNLDGILHGKYTNHTINKEEAEKIVKTIKTKAPVALTIADKLIDDERGCSSELKHLREIFTTSDAMLGLSSVGKRVEFQGK